MHTPTLCGVILLHPCLEGESSSSGIATLLAASRVGRSLLRTTLKAEVGPVFDRRSWHDPSKLTPEIHELYARPLRKRGWDATLIAASTQRTVGPSPVLAWVNAQRSRGVECPCLVVTGMNDVIVPPAKAGGLAYQLGCALSLLPDCGHFSHEEAAPELLDALVTFVRASRLCT